MAKCRETAASCRYSAGVVWSRSRLPEAAAALYGVSAGAKLTGGACFSLIVMIANRVCAKKGDDKEGISVSTLGLRSLGRLGMTRGGGMGEGSIAGAESHREGAKFSS